MREAARAIEPCVARPEGLGGPSPGAGEQGGVVLPHPVDQHRPCVPHRATGRGITGTVLRRVLRGVLPQANQAAKHGQGHGLAGGWTLGGPSWRQWSSGQSGTSRTAQPGGRGTP